MDPLKGILLKLCSVTVFVVMAGLIKATSQDVPPGQAVFFRAFFAIPVIFAWLMIRGELHIGIRVQSPMGHLWRGLIGTMAMGLGFAGLAFLPFPEVKAIGYAAPILTVIFSAMFLGEQVRAFRLGAVALGLVGVLIVLSPRLSNLSDTAGDSWAAFGAMLVLMGAICAALAQVFVRKLVATERTSAIVLWFSVTASCLSLLSLPFGWVIPQWWQIGCLILAGFLGAVGQIFLTSSYRFADASVIAPFEYSSMIFAILIGYFVFDETPTLVMLAGASLIIFAGIIIIWRERQLGLERDRPRKAMTPQG